MLMTFRWSVSMIAATAVVLVATAAHAQIKGQVRPGNPPWSKGLQPISSESYYNAIECGKQGGTDPACVFWDTDMCKNEDFTLTWYSAYKQVAHEVWTAVTKKRPVPQPSYSGAQRTRITILVAPVKGGKNTLKAFAVKRGAKPAPTLEHALSGGGGRFGYDYPAFAPTSAVTLEMVGSARTLTCALPVAVLQRMR